MKEKFKRTKVVPVTMKIILIFSLFILGSNFSTNYLNLSFNRAMLVNLMKQLLASNLESIYEFCNIQNEIYHYSKDLDESKKSMREKGFNKLENEKSVVLGVEQSGKFLFKASKLNINSKTFTDKSVLKIMQNNLKKGNSEGVITFYLNNDNYLGFYKYSKPWDIFIIRAEELNEFYSESWVIFYRIVGIILLITIACTVVGIFALRYILRYISIISAGIINMLKNQRLEIINLRGATNDNITFLGVAFNSLSNTVDNLVTIFRKFATRDVALKAYKEKEIRLEGTRQNLTILFSDIKSFTFITETLGTDIINLLNIHYDKAINEILSHNGIIGSIIGDAILAVFGTVNEPGKNKSLLAVSAAYKLQEASKALRFKMYKKKEEIIKLNGNLSDEEEKIFKAVLIEIGVGLDGGEVFYGNIGSNKRMTNTVIGDNVNSASRLEGLTRIYKVPVICSEYVKYDIESNIQDHKYIFVEIDQVQVKGKTIGKRVYWPIPEENYDGVLKGDLENFSNGLKLYYEGKWKEAKEFFDKCRLPLADAFKERTGSFECPDDWSGIWTMKTK